MRTTGGTVGLSQNRTSGWFERTGVTAATLVVDVPGQAGRGSRPSLMIFRWISLVPSKIVVSRASRQ